LVLSYFLFKFMLMKKISQVLIVLLSIGILSCEKDSPENVESKITFNGGFETNDLSQWNDVNRNLDHPESYQIEIITSPVREGMYAVKTTVHDGDEFLTTGGERCDLERREPYEKEGDDLWYAWSTQFPTDWQSFTYTVPDDWFVIADWHSEYDNVGQLIQLEVNSNNQLWVKGLTGNVSSYTNFTGNGDGHFYEKMVTENLSLGLWNDFVFHVKWTTENEGVIEFWHKVEGQDNFTKILDLKEIPTLQFKAVKSQYKSPYFLLAHYRDASFTHTTTLFHDGFRQGTTKESIQGPNNLYVID